MTALVLGKESWCGERDQKGYRNYELTLRVQSAYSDGPAKVMVATGMPAIGAAWIYGNDNDPWAFNTPYMKITPMVSDGDKNDHWLVTLKFTNNPFSRCHTNAIDNPLSEPVTLGGSFIKCSKRTRTNYQGKFITNSSLEPIPVEKDTNRPVVHCGMNVSSLGLDTFAAMVDTLNDATLWGLPTRCIKLSNVSWERRYYGSCSAYYTRNFEFEVRYETFDVVDEADVGLKHFNPKIKSTIAARKNPKNYIRIKDTNGENAPPTPLDGAGNINEDPLGNPKVITPPIKIYGVSNFLTLGIPSTL